jgi:hypothetical protein
MRITSGSYVILRDQVLEVRKVDGWLHVARKPDEGAPAIERYDPYGPCPSVSAYASDEAIDD